MTFDFKRLFIWGRRPGTLRWRARAIVPRSSAHGGAGNAGPGAERPERRRAMMAAIRLGARILRGHGSALEAVVTTVVALEDHPLFNAGYGSLLNSEGNVEMDASVMFAEPVPAKSAPGSASASREQAFPSSKHISKNPTTQSQPVRWLSSVECEIQSCWRAP